MAPKRVEFTAEEQHRALRAARDRYLALAEVIHSDTALDPAERENRELEARRIASAYSNSVANSLDKMQRDAGGSAPRRRAITIFYTSAAILLAIGIAAIFAVRAPSNSVATVAPQKVSRELAPPVQVLHQSELTSRVPAAAHVARARPTEKARKLSIRPLPLTTGYPLVATHLFSEKKKRVAARGGRTALHRAAPRAALTSPPFLKRLLQEKQPIPRERADSGQDVWHTAEASTFSHEIPPPLGAAQPNANSPVLPTAAPHIVAIAGTHTPPKYPPFPMIGKEGSTRMKITIAASGIPSDCEVVAQSKSEILDQVACQHVLDKWLWDPPMVEGRAVSASTYVTLKWNFH